MIHNMEEKQKGYARQSSISGMLSEKELARLIEQVEEREMLHAPVHLKDNVFTQIRKQRQAAQRLQLFSYRAKVLAGMAAALTVLFLVPVAERNTQDLTQSGIFNQISWQEQENVDEIRQGALIRQQEIERTWQKYQEEQERINAREAYFTGIGNKIRDLRERIF